MLRTTASPTAPARRWLGVAVALLAPAPWLTPGPAHAAITHVPLYTFHGDSAGDEFGYSVSGAGDVNGDGRADLIVGAWRDDNNGSRSGSARVLSGLDGSKLYEFNGDSAFDELGISVSGAGDVNGDGRADLIVGAWQDDNNGFASGSSRVLSGSDGSELYEFDGDGGYSGFGFSVSGAGDVNGDGRADLIVGARFKDNNGSNSGSARVFSGLDGSELYEFNGDSAFDEFGFSVSGAGDVNGDGRADLIVGGLDNSARVLSGFDGNELYEFNGDGGGDQFGFSISGAGDVNGDGRADLIVGANGDDNSGSLSGSARVISGLDGSELYEFNGDSANDRFGRSVSGAGDVNDDGFADLIVGANFDDNNGSNSGSARVLSGLDGSELYEFDGDSANDLFGWSVSGAGDVNGDGIADFIVGATNGGLNNGGYARVFVSQSSTVPPQPTSVTVDFDSQQFATSFENIGSSYQEDGFTVTADNVSIIGSASTFYLGSPSASPLFNDDSFTFTRDDGLAFSITSIEIAEFSTNFGDQVAISAVTKDGTILNSQLTLDGLSGTELLTLPPGTFENLSSFTMEQSSPAAWHLDAITFEIIPEPTSALVLTLGAPLLLRRRSR